MPRSASSCRPIRCGIAVPAGIPRTRTATVVRSNGSNTNSTRCPTREDRAILPDRPRPVPRRDHRRPRARPEPARRRRPGRAQQAVHRVGRDRLPPPRTLRDRGTAAGAVACRWPVPAARPGLVARGGVPLGGPPHGDQDRAGVVAGQHLSGRSAAGPADGRGGVNQPDPELGAGAQQPGVDERRAIAGIDRVREPARPERGA